MKTVKNNTNRPLKISLARGRTLRLGPRKEGQIATSDAERNAFKILVERGDVEVFDDSRQGDTSGVGPGGSKSVSKGHHARFSVTKRGDR